MFEDVDLREATTAGHRDSNDSSAGPQTGVVLPNGVVPNRGGPTERAPTEEIRSSEIPKFRIFDKIAEKRIFYEGF